MKEFQDDRQTQVWRTKGLEWAVLELLQARMTSCQKSQYESDGIWALRLCEENLVLANYDHGSKVSKGAGSVEWEYWHSGQNWRRRGEGSSRQLSCTFFLSVFSLCLFTQSPIQLQQFWTVTFRRFQNRTWLVFSSTPVTKNSNNIRILATAEIVREWFCDSCIFHKEAKNYDMTYSTSIIALFSCFYHVTQRNSDTVSCHSNSLVAFSRILGYHSNRNSDTVLKFTCHFLSNQDTTRS